MTAVPFDNLTPTPSVTFFYKNTTWKLINFTENGAIGVNVFFFFSFFLFYQSLHQSCLSSAYYSMFLIEILINFLEQIKKNKKKLLLLLFFFFTQITGMASFRIDVSTYTF